VGSFGDKLKRERELRGVTLEEIAKATKIGNRALKALEDEHFDQLPGGIFNKGFVRAYAKFLGLDEEQMVADFMAAQGESQGNRPDLMAKLAVQAEAQRRNEIAASGGEKRSSNSTWITLAVLVLLTAGAAAGIRYYQMKKAARAEANRARVVTPAPQPVAPANTPTDANPAGAPMNSATTDPSAVVPAPSTTTSPIAGATTPAAAAGPASSTNSAGAPSGTTTSAKPSATSSSPATPAPTSPSLTAAVTPKPSTSTKGPIELQVRASKATWLSVQTDGKPEIAETLRDSATKTIIAQEKIVITTGNSVDVTCNGKPLGILGTDNQRSQLKITANCKVN
jgi:cytoskeleton protein RodZ